MSILSGKDPCGWEKIPLSLSSFYIGNPKICKHKKNTFFLKNGPCPHKTWQKKKQQKNNKIKNTKINLKCVGGGGLLYLLCLISNTLPQLEQYSLQPSTAFSIIYGNFFGTTSNEDVKKYMSIFTCKGINIKGKI